MVRFWDVRHDAAPLLELAGHDHWLWSVKYNRFHDELVLSASSDHTLGLWNAVRLAPTHPRAPAPRAPLLGRVVHPCHRGAWRFVLGDEMLPPPAVGATRCRSAHLRTRTTTTPTAPTVARRSLHAAKRATRTRAAMPSHSLCATGCLNATRQIWTRCVP